MSEVFHVPVKVQKTCTICRKPYEWDDFYRTWQGGTAKPNNGVCNNCQFWVDNLMYDIKEKNQVIYKGKHYRITTKDSGFNFGGRIFKIKFFDGRELETYLAHQGTIPKHFLLNVDNGKLVPNPNFLDNATVEGL